MDSEGLKAFVETLEAEKQALSTKADTLRTQLSGFDSAIKRIDAAIAALQGDGSPAPPEKSLKAKKPSKKAPGKAKVSELIKSVLARNGVLPEAKLREDIEAELKSEGYSLLGFALRFKEAISDSQFVGSPQGYRLKDAKQAVGKSETHSKNGASSPQVVEVK